MKHRSTVSWLMLIVIVGALIGAPQPTAHGAGLGWDWLQAMLTPRAYFPATLLADGRVLAAGGVTGGTGTWHATADAAIYDLAAGNWTPTGSLNTARAGYTATFLADGRVLAAGGHSFTGTYYASAEVYDPAAGVWTPTAAMADSRQAHTATLLADGRVLVAGGCAAAGVYRAGAELYDPATGLWTATGALSAGRCWHSATLLSDGRVLVAGGFGSAGHVGTAEIYNPASGSWTPTDPLNAGRSGHTATRLPNGLVLVAGGFDGSELASAETYDPGTGHWTTVTSLHNARNLHAATLLASGHVLVSGGSDGGPLDSAEIYDPDAAPADAWTEVGPMYNAHSAHGAVLLPSGRVLLMGGIAPDQTIANVEIYDPTTPLWVSGTALPYACYGHKAVLLPNGSVLIAGGNDSAGAPLAASATFGFMGWIPTSNTMSDPRLNQTLTLLAVCHGPTCLDRVLAAGGWDGSRSLASADLYNPSTAAWAATSPMSRARTAHSATLLADGRVLVAGGYQESGGNRTYDATAEVYDPASATWAPVASMSQARGYHSATLLADGRVLVAGGTSDPDAVLASAELYDPHMNTWTPTANLMSVPRISHTATLLPNGRVLVAGGNDGTNFHDTAEVFKPGTDTWAGTGWILSKRSGHTATLLPDGRVLLAGGFYYDGITYHFLDSTVIYQPAKGEWRYSIPLSGARAYFIATLLPSGTVVMAGGTDNGSNALTSSGLYDLRLGYQAAWRPTITTFLPLLIANQPFALAGRGYRGYLLMEAAGGGAVNGSASNYPLVRLQRIENDQVAWLRADPARPFSATRYDSLPPGLLPLGHYRVTMFVNGIPGEAKIALMRGWMVHLPLVLRSS